MFGPQNILPILSPEISRKYKGDTVKHILVIFEKYIFMQTIYFYGRYIFYFLWKTGVFSALEGKQVDQPNLHLLTKIYLEFLYFHVIIERRASIFTVEAREKRGKKAVRICKYL